MNASVGRPASGQRQHGSKVHLSRDVHEVLESPLDAGLVLRGQLQHPLQQLVAHHLLA